MIDFDASCWLQKADPLPVPACDGGASRAGPLARLLVVPPSPILKSAIFGSVGWQMLQRLLELLFLCLLLPLDLSLRLALRRCLLLFYSHKVRDVEAHLKSWPARGNFLDDEGLALRIASLPTHP